MIRQNMSIDLSEYPKRDREAIIAVFRNHRTSEDVLKLMFGRKFKRHMRRSASSGIIAMGVVTILIGTVVRYFPGLKALKALARNY